VRKPRRRLRRTWGTTGEVLAWIATRDRRRVDDQKVSARAPSKDLEYTRQYFKREPAADWLALIKSAAETTYAKGGKDAPGLALRSPMLRNLLKIMWPRSVLSNMPDAFAGRR
jgi:hypothetical protein